MLLMTREAGNPVYIVTRRGSCATRVARFVEKITVKMPAAGATRLRELMLTYPCCIRGEAEAPLSGVVLVIAKSLD